MASRLIKAGFVVLVRGGIKRQDLKLPAFGQKKVIDSNSVMADQQKIIMPMPVNVVPAGH